MPLGTIRRKAPIQLFLQTCSLNGGLACWNKGDPERALSDIDEAIRLNPGNEKARAVRERMAKRK